MKKYIAELIGTFILVFIGCGTAALIGCDVEGGYLITAFAFGLAIIALAYSVGAIAGGHVNPAVSSAMLITKRMDIKDYIGYVIAQIAGAFLASFLLVWVLGKDSGLGANGLFEGSMLKSIVIEIVLTFIFVLLILGVTDHKKTLTVIHIIGVGLTGTSVNPARSLAPAIIVGGDALKALPAFVIGPMVGGILAAFCWKLISKEE